MFFKDISGLVFKEIHWGSQSINGRLIYGVIL